MAVNQLESSRISEGTMQTGSQHPGIFTNQSRAISRDDVRDGFADPPESRTLFPISTLLGNRVRNSVGESLGKVEEVMLDARSGRIAYAVLSFGGFMGIGDKLFAVPWNALRIVEGKDEVTLDVDRKTLDEATGFNKDDWPETFDPAFRLTVRQLYGRAGDS